MKRVNHFKPNIKPTSEHAQRQWKWNWLRKIKRKMILEGKPINREDFINAGSGIGLFPKTYPYKARKVAPTTKAKSRKQSYYGSMMKPNLGKQVRRQP